MPENRLLIQAAYARAMGLNNSLPSGNPTINGNIANDVDQIVNSVRSVLGDAVEGFLLPAGSTWRGAGAGIFCHVDIVRSKLSQFISYLEYMYQINSTIIEIGSLYNSIKDEELKSRCSDLLSAPDHFDRVINQATLVLEERIRQKANINESLTGAQLVNRCIKDDPARSRIIISSSPDEQNGVANIARGVFFAFRNPTHHHLMVYRREDALKICAFIDYILSLIDGSTVNENN